MKIICTKSDLMEAVNIALKAIPSKTTMPILECLLIEVSGEQIKMTSNDMEMGIETLVKGEIKEEGVIALNAKFFSDIIRKLPDEDITVTTDDNFKATIKCGKAKFDITGQSGESFPTLPDVERKQSVSISQFTLKEVIRQTIFSASDNEANKMMTGELFEIREDCMRVVALDGHRIAIRKIQLKEKYDPVKVIVPGKTLAEISKILSGEISEEAKIFFTDKHIVFEFDDTVVLSRLIEGEYYKIDQMLSGDYETKVTLNKKEFLSCIDRATLMIKESERKPVIINVSENNMELKVNSTVGSMNEDIDIQQEGKDIMIGFNPRFLMDALKVIDEENIDMYMFNPKAPCFIKDKDETYLYLILPVNFTPPSN